MCPVTYRSIARTAPSDILSGVRTHGHLLDSVRGSMILFARIHPSRIRTWISGVRPIDPCAHTGSVRRAALVPKIYLYKLREHGNVTPTQGHEQPPEMISVATTTAVFALCVVYATALPVLTTGNPSVETSGDVSGTLGSPLVMSCTFNGSKNVEWSEKRSGVVKISRGFDDDDTHTLGAPPPTWELQQDGNKSTLTIPNFRQSDVGTYECDFLMDGEYYNGKIQVTKAD